MATIKKSKAEKQAELNSQKKAPVIFEATEETAPLNEGETDIAETTGTIEVKSKRKGNDKIKQIIDHFKSGKSIKIIGSLPVLDSNGNKIILDTLEDGTVIYETFHPTTVQIQINRYKDANPDLYPPEHPGLSRSEANEAKRLEKNKNKAELQLKKIQEREMKAEEKTKKILFIKEEKSRKAQEKIQKYKEYLVANGLAVSDQS